MCSCQKVASPIRINEESKSSTHIDSNQRGIQVLRNADGGGGCLIFWKKALRRCNIQCY